MYNHSYHINKSTKKKYYKYVFNEKEEKENNSSHSESPSDKICFLQDAIDRNTISNVLLEKEEITTLNIEYETNLNKQGGSIFSIAIPMAKAILLKTITMVLPSL